MRNVTSAFKRALYEDKRDYICTADITLAYNIYSSGTAQVIEGHKYLITGTYTSLSIGGQTVTVGIGGYFTAPASGTLTVTGGTSSGNTPTVIKHILSITNEQLWSNGFKIEDAVSNDNLFEIGGAIVNQGTLVLNNIYDEFSDYDFYSAKVVMYIGLDGLDNNIPERVKMGTFLVDDTSYDGSLITLTCLDYMTLLDQPCPYTGGSVLGTIGAIVQRCCSACGVTIATNSLTFPNYDYVIQAFLSGESMTCRQLISWAAQIAGCFARMNADGELEIKFYNFNALEAITEDGLDGGVFDGSGSYSNWLKYYMNTEDGMTTLLSGVYDDQWCSVENSIGFSFNGTVSNYIFIDSDSCYAFSDTEPSGHGHSSAKDVNILMRDGQADSVKYQVISADNESAIKVRFHGYTRYGTSYRTTEYELEYEIFFVNSGKIVINFITLPTNSSYRGTTSIIENGTTKSFAPPTARGKIIAERIGGAWQTETFSGYYATGDTADGGTFNPWNTGYEADGGSLSGSLGCHLIYSGYSHTVSMDEVIITGIRVVEKVDSSTVFLPQYASAYNVGSAYAVGDRCRHNNNLYECISAVTAGAEFDQDDWAQLSVVEYFYGREGYVVSIEGNEMIHGKHNNVFRGQEVANYLGGALVGKKFRKASITHPSDPTIEAGDVAIYFDVKGTQYPIIVSATTFTSGDSQNTTSSAETPQKSNAKTYSASTRNYVEVRQQLNADKVYLEDKIANADGLYQSYGTNPETGSGNIIRYHNKPLIEESDIVMLFTTAGFSLTSNYQDTTPTWYGMTVDGQFIASVIDTIALFFDHAKGGTLKLGGTNNGNGILEIYDASGNRVGRWDNSSLYVGNIASDLTAPNTQIGTNGSITTKSLTANNYVYVDGNQSSYLNIPMGVTEAYTRVSSSGFFVRNRNGDDVYIPSNDNNNKGLRIRPISYSDGQEGVHIHSGAFYMMSKTGNPNYEPWVNIYNDEISLWDTSGNTSYKLFAASADSSSPGVYINGAFDVNGSKHRVVKTKDYATRALSCYETPTPMFGDIGEGIIGDDGYCYVSIDPIFLETIADNSVYQVFLQKYGVGECYVLDRKSTYFIIAGDPGLAFAWEIKAKQIDYDQQRLPIRDIDALNSEREEKTDYGTEAIIHIRELANERNIEQ